MNMLKKIQNKNIIRASIVAAVMLISTVLSNIVVSNAAVEAVVPPGATMDMFDYYVMGKNTDQNYECYAHPEIATHGINAGKQLKFLYNNAVRNHSYDATTAKWMRSVVNDYVNNNDYSFINNIGYGNPKVDSSGYPHVVDPGRIDTSIGYLFDSSSQNGKISYMNATPNIFKKTSDGSYSYSSYDNFARFDTGKKTFTLESKAGGGFFPFDSMSTDYTRCNHYFGMHVTQPFYLPANLKTETGKDIVFQFSGDDDVYIDIDGAVISLNIFLSWHGCTINFSTGAISTDTAGYKANYTLKDLFTRAGITPTGGFSGNTLAGDTYHTLNFYYLERGNWGSNCILKYNIQTKPLTVSYNGNGSDTGDDKDVASHVDESMRIENNWFGKTGYDFKEWNTKADGTGASYEEGDGTAFTEDTTLYAIWTPRTYTIAFDSNSTDATGSMSPMPMTYDVGKALTSNSFSRIGYKFIGWRSSDAAAGKEYADGATVSNLTSTDKATVTMYAQWQPISYTVDAYVIRRDEEPDEERILPHRLHLLRMAPIRCRIGHRICRWGVRGQPLIGIERIGHAIRAVDADFISDTVRWKQGGCDRHDPGNVDAVRRDENALPERLLVPQREMDGMECKRRRHGQLVLEWAGCEEPDCGGWGNRHAIRAVVD